MDQMDRFLLIPRDESLNPTGMGTFDSYKGGQL